MSGDDLITITKGQTVIVQVKGDISASAETDGTHTFDFNAVTAQGALTGTTIESTPSGTGQEMTCVANGSLTTSLDASNPDASLIAAGSTGKILTVLKMEALYEDIELDSIMLTQDAASASSSVNDYTKLYLYDEDGNMIVEATPTAVDTYTINVPDYSEDANGNWVSGFKIANEDSDGAKLTVKADFAGIGTGLGGTSAAQVGWKVAADADVIATGVESGQGATETGTTNSNTHWVYKSVPTVAILSLPIGTLANGTATVFKFSVTAGSQGDIDLREVTFTIATTGASVTALKAYDVTGTEVELNDSGDEVAITTGLTVVEFDSTKVRTIAAGTTKIFELRGTVTGASTGDSIVTQLNGDAAVITDNKYPTTYALAAANDEFVWSDRSATSHSVDTIDWTNGYLVDGLNSTVSNAAVLSL